MIRATHAFPRTSTPPSIPQARPCGWSEGEESTITHRLGGHFHGHETKRPCFRISGANADASARRSARPPARPTPRAPTARSRRKQLWDALKKVFDPEIPVNIVDLGLVYSLELSERLEGGHKVDMQMTLTAPGCGMGPVIAEDAKTHLENVPGVAEAQVDIVWDPPWNQDMITEEGKMVLGLI